MPSTSILAKKRTQGINTQGLAQEAKTTQKNLPPLTDTETRIQHRNKLSPAFPAHSMHVC